MKIHGTPNFIADKYVSAARDALSSGDPVLAENYLQHAEHYNRIILAVREQQIQQGDMNTGPRPRPVLLNDGNEFGEGGNDEDSDVTDTTAAPHGQPRSQELARPFEPPQSQSQPQSPPQHQPRAFDQPRFDDRPQRGDDRPQRIQGDQRPHRDQNEPRPQRDRMDRADRPERPDRVDRDRPERIDRDRPERAERDRPERPDQFGERGDRGFGSERPPAFQPLPAVETGTPGAPAPRRRERFSATPAHEQPEFLRRPVRRPRRDTSGDQPEGEPVAPVATPATDDPDRDV